MTAHILAGNGYTVLTAGQGRQALEVAAEHAGTISLLLTDVVMPQMNGCQLTEALVATIPDLKVVYMSGYADDILAPRGDNGGDAGFIEKPFLAEELLLLVRTVLDGARPDRE